MSVRNSAGTLLSSAAAAVEVVGEKVGCKWPTQAAETQSRTRIKRGDAKACPNWRGQGGRLVSDGVGCNASRLAHATGNVQGYHTVGLVSASSVTLLWWRAGM